MEHKYHKCMADRCNVCDGGLAYCEVCKTGEAGLPTDCPGVPIDSETEQKIIAGTLNYIYGQWVEIPPKGLRHL